MAALLRAAGLVDGQAGTTIAINRPPSAGSQVGNNQAIEVVVTQSQNLALIPLFTNGAFVLHMRAVAAIQNTGGACALALDQTASPAVQASGSGKCSARDAVLCRSTVRTWSCPAGKMCNGDGSPGVPACR